MPGKTRDMMMRETISEFSVSLIHLAWVWFDRP